jgi:hypothetical protein
MQKELAVVEKVSTLENKKQIQKQTLVVQQEETI